MHLSIVIPAKNERDNIAPLVGEIELTLGNLHAYEIIYVDDGSTDDTASVIQQLSLTTSAPLRLIRHRFSSGQSSAIHTGISSAHGQLIVTLDADGQNAPADIPALLTAAGRFNREQDFCIAGHRKQRKDSAWKRLQSKIANAIRRELLGDDTPDTGCGLKIFPRATFLKLPYFDHMHRFLPALVRRLGGHVLIVEVSHRDRQFGVSNYTMLGRLGVGIIDLLGVMWLQRRAKPIDVIGANETEVKAIGKEVTE